MTKEKAVNNHTVFAFFRQVLLYPKLALKSYVTEDDIELLTFCYHFLSAGITDTHMPLCLVYARRGLNTRLHSAGQAIYRQSHVPSTVLSVTRLHRFNVLQLSCSRSSQYSQPNGGSLNVLTWKLRNSKTPGSLVQKEWQPLNSYTRLSGCYQMVNSIFSFAQIWTNI